MELGLRGKRVLITGASRGIGRATAQALAQEGAKVFLVARGESALASVSAELASLGAEVGSSARDVSSEAGAHAAVDAALEHFGGLEVLVNNVGGSLSTGAFEKTSSEQWQQVMNVNFMSAVWCSQRAVAAFKKQGAGAIVHVNSICGREYCSSSSYTAAKSAMTGLTKEMAVSLAPHGIRVNGVAPGSILFPGGSWERRRQDNPAAIEKMVKESLPWGRFGAPEEVARVICFLASDAASWMSGATVPVDGAQGRAF